MPTVAEMPPPTIRWDLADLFSGPDDPRIEESWIRENERAEEFAKRYRGKINSADLTATTLLNALQELEVIAQEASKPVNFAQLSFVTDTGNPAKGAFLQKQMERSTELNVRLMFFELELQAMPEAKIEDLMRAPELANYRHYIHVTRSFSPYRLSEPEEIVAEELSNTGSRAWVRLFEGVAANQIYRYAPPGGGAARSMNQEEVLSLLRDPNREIRQAAADAFTTGLRELQRVIVFAYNTLLQDKSVEDRLRKLPYPEHSRHLSNELS